MKRLLVDINVVLDVLLDRQPHAVASSAVWAAVEDGVAEGLLAARRVTTVHYLLAKDQGVTRAKQTISAILRVFGVATVDGNVIRQALESKAADFEDAVAAAAAQVARCDLIVTRDPKGFADSAVRALTPEAAAPILVD